MKIKKKKNIMNRKGMGVLVIIILALVGAIVGIAFVIKWIGSAGEGGAIKACQLSVAAQSATEFTPGVTGKKSPFNLECKKRYINMQNNKVLFGFSPEESSMSAKKIYVDGQETKRFTKLTDNIADQVIAEELRVCKTEFNDGRIDIFVNGDAPYFGDDVCFVCSEITFDTKTVDQQTFSTLKAFTQDTTFDATGKSYYDYLTEKVKIDKIAEWPLWVQGAVDENQESDLKMDLAQIDTSKKYYVLVYRHFHGYALDGVAFGAFSDTPNIMALLLLSQDNVNKYCKNQAN